jgi:hypothetical protein
LNALRCICHCTSPSIVIRSPNIAVRIAWFEPTFYFICPDLDIVGCGRQRAGRLAAYIAAKYQPGRLARDIDQIDVADALSIYLDDCGPGIADQLKLQRTIGRLNDYWGGKKLSAVTAAECRAYVQTRGRVGGARADLETLRAAINHHAKESLHHGTVRVTLPPKGPARDRWLARDEAAGRAGVIASARPSIVGSAKDRRSRRTSTCLGISRGLS